MRATASYLDERLVVPAIFQPFAADRVGVSAIDDGYPLIWMCFSTLVFLLCCLYSKTTNFSKQVCLFLLAKTHPKEKRGGAIIYRL